MASTSPDVLPVDPTSASPYRYAFTVFTPTFNRAQTLSRVYESLKAQTFRDFEWLVVDDGSTDGTSQLVQSWHAQTDFPIRYIYQQNQGKPAACNLAAREAQGEFLLTLDSDDACVPQSLERFKFHWDAIPADQKHLFSAVTVLCQDQNGGLVGTKYPRDIIDSDSIEIQFKYGVKGEKWGFQRTEVLRQFLFPTVPNAKFIAESIVWLAVARKFKTRFVNEILRIYHIDDGANDHLSTLTPSAMYGRAYVHKYILEELTDWLFRAPGSLFKSAINFSRYSFGLGKGPLDQLREVQSLTSRCLLALSLPVGYAMSLRDRSKS
jgi:glycosyltransferase involved in cell wall biosynthesis